VLVGGAVLLASLALNAGQAGPSPRRSAVIDPSDSDPASVRSPAAMPGSGHAGGPVVLSRQVITLPFNAGPPIFADVEGNGRSDLLAIELGEKKLLNYRQRPDGFTSTPDQAVSLPPQTAWVALGDVDAHPGLELVFSTSTGLVYSRQNAGLFESERRPLIEASQPFTSFDSPTLTLLSTNLARGDGTNDLIPVITAGQTVLYHRNSAYEWSPGPPMTLDVKRTVWDVDGNPWRLPWRSGSNPAHRLRVQKFFRAKPVQQRDEEPENETIRKIMDDMKKNAEKVQGIVRVDVDGDGRKDLVLWQSHGMLDFRTDIYIFLRRADQKLPESPTQVLHCGGVPIPVSSTAGEVSPLHDLNGDGTQELVLIEPTTVFTSKSDLVEMLLARGFECSVKIRSLHRRVFARNLDGSVPVRLILALDELTGWPFCIQGDFNGDGRPELLVRRSETQWNIYFSTKDGSWFKDQPAMTIEAPARGFFKIIDLNDDGLADIIWHDLDNPNLSIFMSPSRPAKGKKP
jgi:hypothetical protein